MARANTRVEDVLERGGVVERIGSESVFPTINAAVRAFERSVSDDA